MEILGRTFNGRLALWWALQLLIIVDIVLISIVMLAQLPEKVVLNIQLFDLCVCIILLIQWGYNFYISKPKKVFLKQKSNWIDLIASIPFDVILPAVIPQIKLLRYLRLLKLLRVLALIRRFSHGLKKFIKASNFDKIVGALIFIIILFTLILYVCGPSYDLFDDFYFVIVTLATVGYGDVVPVTFQEKVISIILILIGILVFSTVTASISSYLTDKLIRIEDDAVEEKLNKILDELESIRQENKELKNEIGKLKNEKDQ